MPRAPRRQSGEARRGAYKARVDFSRSRRRREDDLLALRRLDRDAGLFKRRRDEPSPAVPASDPAPVPVEAAPPAGITRPILTPSSPPDVAAPRNAAETEVRQALLRVRSTYFECFRSSVKQPKGKGHLELNDTNAILLCNLRTMPCYHNKSIHEA